MVFDIFNAVVAGLAFIISIISLLWQWLSSRFSLSIDFNDEECFFFEPLSTRLGNRESLIVSVRISNTSNQPIHIASAQIVLDNGYSTQSFSAEKCYYPSHLPPETHATRKGTDGLLQMKLHTCDGYSVENLSDSLIRFPLYLQPYESVSGFLLFPLSGESTAKTTIRFVTSRRKHSVTHSFMSKHEYETRF